MRSGHRHFHLSIAPILICLLFLVIPAAAFTAESLKITVRTDGDATAEFDYTLEGLIENAIPESLLEKELVKGLSTSDEPPEVMAFDKSGVTLLLKDFAQLSDTPAGTEYLTAGMDFSRAEIALQDSAVSSVITADFTPHTTTVTFPDGYKEVFTDSSTLPSLRHVVIDPSKKAVTTVATPRPRTTTSIPMKSTTVVAPAAAAIVTDATTAVPVSTPPASGLPITVTVLAVLGLAGAGTYIYAVRNE